jgi:hypothetical protein
VEFSGDRLTISNKQGYLPVVDHCGINDSAPFEQRQTSDHRMAVLKKIKKVDISQKKHLSKGS